MAESQEDIDALLAEVSALADEAVVDVGGEESGGTGAAQSVPNAGQTASPPPPGQTGDPQRTSPGQPAPLLTCGPGEKIQRILKLSVPLIVKLGERTMPLSTITNLSTGAIIEFDKAFDDDLDLMINNKCIGRGQAVKVGENFGLRVSRIGSVAQRVQAMGGSSA